MRRKLFTLAAGVSLLLCVAVCVLWVRSYGVMYGIRWGGVDRQLNAASSQGRVVFQRVVSPPSPNLRLTPGYTRLASPPEDVRQYGYGEQRRWDLLGVSVRRGRVFSGRGNMVIVPHGYIVLALLVPPGAWLVWHRRGRRIARRRERGACPHCGYDLRSGGGHERCPECGTATARGEPAAA